MKTYAPRSYEQPFERRYFESNRRRGLSKFLGRLSMQETISLDERLDEELYSGFIEALDGDVVCATEFDVVDGYVVSRDGERLYDMLLRCRKHDYEVASRRPEMGFVTLRSEAEINELLMVQQMIRRGTRNKALVTFSPYTEELIKRPDLLKEGYQRPELKRSMLRVSLWDGAKLHMISCSLDNSSLDSLRAVCISTIGKELGGQLSHEVLSEHFELYMTHTDALALASSIQRDHKKLVGYSADSTAAVLQSRPDIYQSCKREIKQAASLSKTFEEFQARKDRILYQHLATYSRIIKGEHVGYDLTEVLPESSAKAADAGESFSMCGDVVGASLVSQPLAPFESIMRLSSKIVKCPNGGCGKMVVIEDKFLKQGILHCPECKHTVDVCGDNNKASRIKGREQSRKRTSASSNLRHQRKSSTHKGVLARIYQL